MIEWAMADFLRLASAHSLQRRLSGVKRAIATMTGEGDGHDWPAGVSTKSSGKDGKREARQDRLKSALRQNLKRRKSQARGRDDLAVASPDKEEAAPYGERDEPDRG
jgi:hypothetical protein